MLKLMKNTLLGFTIVSLLILSLGPGVNAATTATVTATVTVQNISVSVSDGSIAYGTMQSNTSKSTLPAEANDMQTATNNGNVTETLNIKGQSSVNWTLANTAGSDQYLHKFCNDTDNDCTTPPTNYTVLSTNYQTLDTGIAQSGTVDFQLQITTPNPSTVYTQQSVDVTVQAVAS